MQNLLVQRTDVVENGKKSASKDSLPGLVSESLKRQSHTYVIHLHITAKCSSPFDQVGFLPKGVLHRESDQRSEIGQLAAFRETIELWTLL